ncbi:hypothetical protein FQA39_LY18057 [Lamprigera yunnana]|nr:hypothetical protein FQA39_LY18057 [Lamprigera yunnana]
MSGLAKSCRICLTNITRDLHWGLLSWTLRDMLMEFLPEIDLEYVDNAVICSQCIAGIETAYKYKRICIATEKIIKDMREKSIPFDYVQTFIHGNETEILNENGDVNNKLRVASDYDVQVNASDSHESFNVVDNCGNISLGKSSTEHLPTLSLLSPQIDTSVSKTTNLEIKQSQTISVLSSHINHPQTKKTPHKRKPNGPMGGIFKGMGYMTITKELVEEMKVLTRDKRNRETSSTGRGNV